VVEQWRRSHGPDADLKFVVDHSLRAEFVRERALDQWNQLAHDFDLIGQLWADGMILDLAMAGAPVRHKQRPVLRLSAQASVDRAAAGALPWLEGDERTLRFVPSGIKPEEDYKTSRAEEKSEMHRLGYF